MPRTARTCPLRDPPHPPPREPCSFADRATTPTVRVGCGACAYVAAAQPDPLRLARPTDRHAEARQSDPRGSIPRRPWSYPRHVARLAERLPVVGALRAMEPRIRLGSVRTEQQQRRVRDPTVRPMPRLRRRALTDHRRPRLHRWPVRLASSGARTLGRLRLVLRNPPPTQRRASNRGSSHVQE